MSDNILECIKKGLLNSVSVLINYNYKIHKKLKNLKGVKIKLHLNLTELKSTNIKKIGFFRNLTFIRLLCLVNQKGKKFFTK